MKKYTIKMMAMMMVAALAMVITSCGDEDDYIAYDLSGAIGKSWTGYIQKYYYDRWGLSGDEYRTTIYFDSNGTGYEVDYNTRSRYSDYYYSKFFWTVRDRTIIIRYDDNDFAPVTISDFTLGSDYFSGYIDDGTNNDIRFRLALDRDFDWDPYYSYYDPYYDPYYYAKPMTRATGNKEKANFHASGEFAKKKDDAK